MKNEYLNIGARIALEIGVTMKVEIEGVTLPLESCFVGIEGDYLIIRTPAPASMIDHKLFKGSELIVKYISNGTVFAFQTKVFGVIRDPIKLLLLEYPKIVQRHELRHHKRCKCFIPTTALLNEAKCMAVVLDIGRTGCKCVIPKDKVEKRIQCNLDEEIELLCNFPGSREPVLLRCVVKNIINSKKEMELGLSFGDISEEVRKIVYWYVGTLEDYS